MKTRTFCTLLVTAALACCWTACSDKENDDVNSDDKDKSYFVMTAAQIADYAADNFICHVCNVELDHSTMKPTSWEVNYGRVLHPETPNVRYARAETLENARQEFLSMICEEATANSNASTGVTTVEMGSHGMVKFSPVNQNGEWARVEINLKELPDLQAIVFCKPEAWPENDSDIGVKRCMVFKRFEEGHDVYYICVKECGTPPGYLIGFDTWTIDPTIPSTTHRYRDRNCYDAWWWNLPGGEDIIKHLQGFLYCYDGQKDTQAEAIIRKIGELQGGNPANVDKCGQDALYNFLYSAGKLKGRFPFFKTGDDHGWVDIHHNLYGEWHFVRTPYTKMTPTSVESTKICYECDEVDPNSHNAFTTHSHDAWTNKWGEGWCIQQFGAEWIWKVGEWYSFQKPYIIEFRQVDTPDFQSFLDRYHLTQVE